jgi:hypothetical protein
MAQFGSTFRELSIQYAKKQPKQVSTILEKAPILDIWPFMEASHGLWNVYEEETEVTGAQFIELDSVLPEVGTVTGLKRINLGIMGGKMTVLEDRAKLLGGRDAYFAKRMPSVLKKTGQTTEFSLVYDNLRRYALATSGRAVSCGGSSNAGYSMIFVRFEEGVTTGLYSPDGFKQGAMLHSLAINGGNLYERQADGKLCYGVRLKGYFGMQIADPRTVFALVNIDSSNKPTEDEIDDALAAVRADEGNTYILCHRRCRNFLNQFKEDRLEMRVNEKHFSRSFTHWDDVPILTSYNMLEGTEANATVTA